VSDDSTEHLLFGHSYFIHVQCTSTYYSILCTPFGKITCFSWVTLMGRSLIIRRIILCNALQVAHSIHITTAQIEISSVLHKSVFFKFLPQFEILMVINIFFIRGGRAGGSISSPPLEPPY